MSTWLLKNSAGAKDGSFTFAVISFLVVTACVLLSCLDYFQLGKYVVHFKTADSTLALGYLAASFSTYVVRRATKEDANPSNKDK